MAAPQLEGGRASPPSAAAAVAGRGAGVSVNLPAKYQSRPARGVAGPGPPSNVSSGVFGNSFVEAPAFFKRNGVYYALFGNCCCFCGHGSGIGVCVRRAGSLPAPQPAPVALAGWLAALTPHRPP